MSAMVRWVWDNAADETWKADARCRGMDPAIFFPTRTDAIAEEVRFAKAVCQLCAVQQQCLDYNLARALLTDDPGIWGGTTPNERKTLRRARRING